MKIQIILGSTRPGRAGEQVAKWTVDTLKDFKDAEFELVDIADYNLPLLDEPMPPLMGQYTKDHTKKWSAKIAEADGYIFVTAEYNHSVPGAFKNAVDFLNHEWHDKAIGFIGYGAAGGSRAIEQWRQVAGELHMADVRDQVLLYLGTDFENYSTFKPTKEHTEQLKKLAEEVVAWSSVLSQLRK